MKSIKTNKIFFVLILFLIIILTVSFSSPVPVSKWELAYKHNSYGKRISGDLDKLISAVMDGNDIKVMLHFDKEDLHYQMLLSKVKVDICERIVTGYNYDYRQNSNENNVYSRISTYSTDGEYMSTYEENNFYRSPEIIMVSMSWFISK